MSPALTVIIPAYNVAAWIRASVESALQQSLPDVEVIVVDDGSTDGTPAILTALAAENYGRRLKIVRRENGGLSAARNSGLAMASGRYVGFLDGDDLWDPRKAERHIAVMESDDTIGLTFSYSQVIAENGAVLGLQVPKRATPQWHDMLRRNYVGNGSAAIVRRRCFDRAQLFDETLRSCEDYEMWCRLLYRTGCRAVLVPEPLTLYRIRTTSLCQAFGNFIAQGDIAVERLRTLIPSAPAWLFLEARAEHRRVAAWRALTSGRRWLAARYVAASFLRCPWLYASDWRAVCTATAILMPAMLRQRLQNRVTAARRSRQLARLAASA